MAYRILPITEKDVDEMLEIENQSFPHPWSRKFFEDELKNPISFAFTEKAAYEDKEVLLSYIVFWIVYGEAHILNIAVKPGFRRMGFGRRLLSYSLDFMSQKGVREVYLEVRMSNRAARRFYEGFGFEEFFIRENYYGDEDAIVMKLELDKRMS